MKKLLIAALLCSSVLCFTGCGEEEQPERDNYKESGKKDKDDEDDDKGRSEIEIPDPDDDIDPSDETDPRYEMLAGYWIFEEEPVIFRSYKFDADGSWDTNSEGGDCGYGDYTITDDDRIILNDYEYGNTYEWKIENEELLLDASGNRMIRYLDSSVYPYEQKEYDVYDDVQYAWMYRDSDDYDTYFVFDTDLTWYCTNDGGDSVYLDGTYDYDGETLTLHIDDGTDMEMVYDRDECVLIDWDGDVLRVLSVLTPDLKL